MLRELIKGICFFTAEDEWVDLDNMQSSMQAPLFHLHNILATWDTWGFDASTLHPTRNRNSPAEGSMRGKKMSWHSARQRGSLKVTAAEGYNSFMEAVNMSKRGQILLLHNHSKGCGLNICQLDCWKTFFSKTLRKAVLPTNINPK